jgi:hypothetical protein
VKCTAAKDDINTCVLKGLEQSSGEQGLCVHSNISLSKNSEAAKHKKTKIWPQTIKANTVK